MKKKAIIITTINQGLTEGIKQFSKREGYRLILVGDKKSPAKYDVDADYLDVQKQERFFKDLSQSLPFNHYTRKNIGYAYAIGKGYSVIAESDDDNIPYDHWHNDFDYDSYSNTVTSPSVLNIYSLFTKKTIWPRGYPLQLLSETRQKISISKKVLNIGVWQGLVDKEPDVDAIYRLIIGEDVVFDKAKRFSLDRHVICPFNSQNTYWNKGAFPFLYLPCTVSFRYTDILRSYVAQFGLWARGLHLGFVSPNCFQERNPHNLMTDFKDEVPMYLEAINLISTLNSTLDSLTGTDQDLVTLYKALYQSRIVKKEEIAVVERWLDAIQ